MTDASPSLILGPHGFDWSNPEYVAVYRRRAEALGRIRSNPSDLPLIKAFYRDNPAQFIQDWGMTYDPRNAEIDRPNAIPFIMFPKQVEWIEWIMARWRGREDGITEKSRDMGISWLAIGLACTLCIFREGLSIGFGSKTEDDVDKSGDPQSLFWKARQFVSLLPLEFRAGFDGGKATTSHMRLSFPETSSIIKGDAGDDLGRGDRTSLYFVDESSKLARPALVDAALSQTTNCRQDLSTPRGRANRFAERRFSGRIPVFTFHWRDDPRKGDAWYAKQVERLDPVTLAQEIDIDYSASVEGVMIPSAWVQSAIGAARKLGLHLTGRARGAFDVADQGVDTNAFLAGRGVELRHIEEWSGRGDDMLGSTQRVFSACDANEITEFRYDADGLGAGVAGFARALNEPRRAQGRPTLSALKFQGSGAVVMPDAEDEPGRKNKDFFANLKAQSWWALRKRAQLTHQAVASAAAGQPYTGDPDDLWSIDESLPLLGKLCNELSQPTFSTSVAGKILVDKTPDGAKSPNLADTVMIYFAKLGRAPISISEGMLARSRR